MIRNSLRETPNPNNNYDSSAGFKNMNENDGNSVLKMTSTQDNMKVVIRVRPALAREMEIDLPFRSVVNLKII
jgi:hypothetical protein